MEQEQKRARRNKLLLAGGAVLLALLFFLLGWFSRYLALGKNARSLLWAVETEKEKYYKDVDEDALYREFFSALSLDPYTEYFTKEEYARVLSEGEGEGSDTGLSFLKGEPLRIFRVAGNSPAERAGLLAGMTVFRFGKDEASLSTGSREELFALARKSEKFSVECGFEGGERAVYTLGREEYYVSSVLYRDSDAAFRFVRNSGEKKVSEEPKAAPCGGLALPASVAYLRIDEFYGTAAEEVGACLRLMKERGRKHLVLDLRSNGGGYLSVFQALCSHFLRNAREKRPVAATARFRDGSVTEYLADGNDFSDWFSPDSKLWLLADENTASASECLIGALVSYGALSYGDIFLRKEGGAHTYGKGIMQSSYTGPNGGVMKLTVAEIFWPNGRSIHGTGVTEADGAVGIEAPLLPDKTDSFLEQAAARICAVSGV